jgi:enamine deaminase RidA (YjgF/YER057c/UK114 family)
MGLKIYYSADITQLPDGVSSDKVLGIVVLGIDDSKDYHQFLHELKTEVHGLLGRGIPVTYVPQPLLPGGGLSYEIYVLEEGPEVCFGGQDGVCYGFMKNEQYSMLFVEGVASSDFSEDVHTQSSEVFGKVDALLSSHGFAAGDIVRQWNYIGNITGCRRGRQNYQEFNDARSFYYGKSKWDKGYPAATGIGISSDGIIVGCIAFKRNDADGIYPINNPLQIAAHEYSRKVLVDDAADALKTTPKFERAKLIEISGEACCFVSGTAAIRGESSMDMSSARLQTIQTIENIEYLVSKENLAKFGCKAYELNPVNLRIYVKNEEDYGQVRTVIEERYPDVPVVYTVADVCRQELLVEIEGIFIS